MGGNWLLRTWGVEPRCRLGRNWESVCHHLWRCGDGADGDCSYWVQLRIYFCSFALSVVQSYLRKGYEQNKLITWICVGTRVKDSSDETERGYVLLEQLRKCSKFGDPTSRESTKGSAERGMLKYLSKFYHVTAESNFAIQISDNWITKCGRIWI